MSLVWVNVCVEPVLTYVVSFPNVSLLVSGQKRVEINQNFGNGSGIRFCSVIKLRAVRI